MLKGIHRTPLQSEIIRFIQEYIAEKELRPGDKLPSQAQFIELMGVSRTSLREAIKTLEAKNILEVKNGKGIYVRDNYEQGLTRQLEFTEEKEMLLELLETRLILEREILRLVVDNATDAELDRLGEVLEIVMGKYLQGERQNVEDRQFHYMIHQFSHHRIMSQLIESIHTALDRFWEFPLGMEDPFTDTMPLHADLYHALRSRNAKKAQEINERILDQMIEDVKRQR